MSIRLSAIAQPMTRICSSTFITSSVALRPALGVPLGSCTFWRAIFSAPAFSVRRWLDCTSPTISMRSPCSVVMSSKRAEKLYRSTTSFDTSPTRISTVWPAVPRCPMVTLLKPSANADRSRMLRSR